MNRMTNYNDGKASIADLRAHFSYDAETGLVTTKTCRRNLTIGQTIGTKDRQGYLVTSLYKEPIKVHRLAWALSCGSWPQGMIDHINGDTSDNRLCNLRVVTNAQNKQNIGKSSANKSGYLGVSFHKKSGKWAANIKVMGAAKYLGIFDCPKAASEAYLAAKRELHPFSEVTA